MVYIKKCPKIDTHTHKKSFILVVGEGIIAAAILKTFCIVGYKCRLKLELYCRKPVLASGLLYQGGSNEGSKKLVGFCTYFDGRATRIL